MTTPSTLRFWALSPLLMTLSATLSGAQSVKLNDRLIGLPLGSVQAYALAAGGTRAVFKADLTGTSTFPELHSVPLDGSAPPLLLTGSLSGTILDFTTAGSGEHVFVAARSADNVQRLFRVPAAGGTPLLLSQGGELVSFPVAPTQERVVFLAEFTTGVVELFSVPTDASSPRVKLNGAMAAGGDVVTAPGSIQISPDGTRVVYLADQDADNVVNLYSAPIAGGSPAVRLNQSAPLADVWGFQIAFDSLGVVYGANQETPSIGELYAVVIDGSLPPVKRSGSASSSAMDFKLAAGSDRLIWLRRSPSGQRELFSVGAIAGGTPVKLNAALIEEGDVTEAWVSADGQRVVYVADQETDNVYQLYGVPADGSEPAVQLSGPEHHLYSFPVSHVAEGRVLFYSDADLSSSGGFHSVPLDGSQPAVRLHGDLPAGGAVTMFHGMLADGTVLFTASLETAGVDGLWAAPIDGSAAPVRLNDELLSGASIEDGSVRFTPLGYRVTFLIDDDVGQAEKDELFSALVLGGENVRLSPEPTEGTPFVDVLDGWQVSGDGARAVYLAAESPSEDPNLHSVRTDGSGRSTQLNPPPSGFASIGDQFQISPDGSWVVFRLINGFDVELYSSPIDAPENAFRLDRPPAPSEEEGVFHFQVTPDSQNVVFTCDGLYVAPIDGSLPPELLATPLEFVITSLALSPDGAWVVYREGNSQQGALYSVPLDGHQGPTELGPLNSSHAFFITPDSSRVLHVFVNGGQAELYSTPIDGGLLPVRLDDPADGPVTSYRPSSDGARAVYIAKTQSGPWELYSVPIAGGARVKLNGPLVAGGNVIQFAVDPSTDRIAYVADQETDLVSELFSVPADGSAPAVKLSGVQDPNFNVYTFLFAAGRVVYSTEFYLSWRIYSTSIDGSSPPIALTPVLTADTLNRQMELTADGSGVVYVSAQRHAGVIELFHVPIEASAPAQLVSGPMVAGGDVQGFRVSPDGEHVIYSADQEIDEVFELFSGLLERRPRRASSPSQTIVR